MATATEWVLDVVDGNNVELALWDRLHGNDVFIRLDGRTGEAFVRDYEHAEHKVDLVIFLHDFAQVRETEAD